MLLLLQLLCSLVPAVVGQEYEFSFVDFDRLVHPLDRFGPDKKLAALTLREEECPKNYRSQVSFTVYGLENGVSFSLDLGQLMPRLDQQVPPEVYLPFGRLTVRPENIQLDVPLEALKEDGYDANKCDKEKTTIQGERVIFKAPGFDNNSRIAVTIRGDAQGVASLLDSNFKFSEVISMLNLNPRNPFSDPSVTSLCGPRNNSGRIYREYLRVYLTIIKNFYYTENGTVIRLDLPLGTVLHSFSSSAPMPNTTEQAFELGYKFCQSQECLPFFLYGPEFRRIDQCQIRCRPKSPEKSNSICPRWVSYDAVPDSLDINCQIEINGRKVTKTEPPNTLLVHVPNMPGKLNLILHCRVPSDQSSAFNRQPDGSTLDPELFIEKDDKEVFRGTDIGTKLGKPPAAITTDTLKFATAGLQTYWRAGDFRFFNIHLPLVSPLRQVESTISAYKFWFRYAGTPPRPYNHSMLANLVIVEKNGKLDDQDIGTFKGTILREYYLEPGAREFDLDCGFVPPENSIGMKSVWAKYLRLNGVEDFWPKVHKGHHLDSEEFRRFLQYTDAGQPTGGAFKLIFKPEVSISMLDSGLYRCFNPEFRHISYHSVFVLDPPRCDALIEGDTLPSRSFELTSDSGFTFSLDALQAAAYVTVALRCRLGSSFTAKLCQKTHICDPVFMVFRDGQPIFSSLADITDDETKWQPLQAEAVGLKMTLVANYKSKYTVMASFLKLNRYQKMANSTDATDYFAATFDSFTLRNEVAGHFIREDADRVDRCQIVLDDLVLYNEQNVALMLPATVQTNVTWLCHYEPNYCTGKDKDCDETPRIEIGYLEKNESQITKPTFRPFFRHGKGFISADSSENRLFEAILLPTVTIVANATNRMIVNFQIFQQKSWFSAYADPKNLTQNVTSFLSKPFTIRFFRHNVVENIDVKHRAVPVLHLKIEPRKENTFEKTCRRTPPGYEYIGTEAKTICGDDCSAWKDSPWLHPILAHLDGLPEAYINASAENFCRNPGKEKYSLWCPLPALVDDKRWAFCHVPPCDDENEFFLRNYERFYGDCACKHHIGDFYVNRPIVDMGERLLKCWPNKQSQRRCRENKDWVPFYKGYLGRKSVDSPDQCASICEWTPDCQGFVIDMSKTEQPMQCVLKNCTCSDVKCDPRTRQVYYRRRNNPTALVEPTVADDSKTLNNVDSYYIHAFEEGAIGIKIPCHALADLPDEYLRFARWELLDLSTGDYVSLNRKRYGRGNMNYEGYYFYFSPNGISADDNGLYRCVFNTTAEYHRVTIYETLVCRLYVNQTLLNESTAAYSTIFQIVKPDLEAVKIDYICFIGRRRVEFCGERLCNPSVTVLKDGLANVPNMKIGYNSSQNFVYVQIPTERWKRATYTFNLTFIPKPMLNNFPRVNKIQLSDGPIWNMDANLENQQLYESEIQIQAWPNQPPVKVTPSSPGNAHVDVRIEPGSIFKVQFVYTLRRHLALCGWDDDTERCLPVEIDYIKKANDPINQQITELPLLKGFQFDNTTSAMLTVECAFTNDKFNQFIVRFSFGPSIPSLDLESHRMALAGIYAISVSIGDSVIDEELYQTNQMSIEVKVAPSHFQIGSSLDCYMALPATDYRGNARRTACSNQKCLHSQSCRVAHDDGSYSAGPFCTVDKQLERDEFCAVPSCYDYGDVTLGGLYDRYIGHCDKCVYTSIEYTRVGLDLDMCKRKCEEIERCSGFDYTYEDGKPLCHINVPPCSCQASDFLVPECIGRTFTYHFIKRTPNGERRFVKDDSPYPTVYIQHAGEETTSYQMRPVYFSSWQETVTWSWSYKTPGGQSKTIPPGVDSQRAAVFNQPLLKFNGGLSKPEHEGVYLLGNETSPFAFQYHFLKVPSTPECHIYYAPERFVTAKSYHIKFSNYRNLLDQTRSLEIRCMLGDAGRSLGYCGHGGFANGICNPKIAFIHAQGYAYKSWPSTTPVHSPSPLTVATIGSQSGSQLNIIVTLRNEDDDIYNYNLAFRYTPSTETKLLMPDDESTVDETDSDMQPVIDYSIVNKQSANVILICVIFTVLII